MGNWSSLRLWRRLRVGKAMTDVDELSGNIFTVVWSKKGYEFLYWIILSLRSATLQSLWVTSKFISLWSRSWCKSTFTNLCRPQVRNPRRNSWLPSMHQLRNISRLCKQFHIWFILARTAVEEDERAEEEASKMSAEKKHKGDDLLLEGCNKTKIIEFKRNVSPHDSVHVFKHLSFLILGRNVVGVAWQYGTSRLC